MMKLSVVLAAVICALGSTLALAEKKTPTAVDLLFDAQHLTKVKKGDEIKYQFERAVENSKRPNQSFEDSIRIEVTNETPEKAKNLKLKVFTGDRERNPFETPGMTGNPLLIWYLNRCVASFNSVAGGSTIYLKKRISESLGETGNVEAAKLDVDGASVDGYKVKVTPFTDDPAKPRMNGYENSTFEFLVSDKIPGYFHTLRATYFSNGKGTPRITETISFQKVGEAE